MDFQSLGAGIAFGSLCFSGAAVAIKAIGTKKIQNGNSSPKSSPTAVVCPAHSGIEVKLDSLVKGQERIEKNIEKLFNFHDQVRK
jgi:hypothetical protein